MALPDQFAALCLTLQLPEPVQEYKFHPTRKWKIDWAWPKQMIALELEGGAYHGHGHRSVGKYLRDIEKYNELSLAGWRLLRVTTKQMKNGEVFLLLKRVFCGPVVDE